MFDARVLGEFEKRTNLKLGSPLSVRRNVIHSLRDYPGRVVKIDNCVHNIDKFMMLLSRINKMRVVPTVKIYQYGRLSNKHYYYVMNRLTPLPLKEFETFYRSLASWLRDESIYSPNFNWRNPKLSPKLKAFLYQAKALSNKYGYTYGDLHEGNIMKTKKGEYRFIDLESFV